MVNVAFKRTFTLFLQWLSEKHTFIVNLRFRYSEKGILKKNLPTFLNLQIKYVLIRLGDYFSNFSNPLEYLKFTTKVSRSYELKTLKVMNIPSINLNNL